MWVCYVKSARSVSVLVTNAPRDTPQGPWSNCCSGCEITSWRSGRNSLCRVTQCKYILVLVVAGLAYNRVQFERARVKKVAISCYNIANTLLRARECVAFTMTRLYKLYKRNGLIRWRVRVLLVCRRTHRWQHRIRKASDSVPYGGDTRYRFTLAGYTRYRYPI